MDTVCKEDSSTPFDNLKSRSVGSDNYLVTYARDKRFKLDDLEQWGCRGEVGQ